MQPEESLPEERLLAALVDGSLSDDEFAGAMDRLVCDAPAFNALVDAVVLDDLLSQHVESTRDEAHAQWLDAYLAGTGGAASGEVGTVAGSQVAASRGAGRGRLGLRTALAAAVCAAAAVVWLLSPSGQPGREPPRVPVPSVGHFTRSANVQWSAGAHRWSVGDALAAGESVAFDSGRVELQFDSGAVMTVVGPAALEIQSASLVALHSGTATTHIERGSSGEFRVVTPATEVLDLGTEFGVRARPDGQTEVVVFDGKVDVTPVAAAVRPRAPQTLVVGEALCMNGAGDWQRLVSIESEAFPCGERMFPAPRRRPDVIVGIHDDLRSPESPKYYRIYHEGLDEDARAFVDRTHEWNGLGDEGMPHFLRGADYVAMFNDDKHRSTVITVDVSTAAVLYVFFDDRMAVPDWLSESFENTGFKIGLDEGPSRRKRAAIGAGPGVSIDEVHSIWKRRIDRAGSVTLGPAGRRPTGRTMYGIAAQPL